MKEVKLKVNPLGIKIFAIGEPSIDNMSEEEYSLFASSLALRINEYVTKSKNDKEDQDAI